MINLEELYISPKVIASDPLNGLGAFLNNHLTKTFKKLKRLSLTFSYPKQFPDSFFE